MIPEERAVMDTLTKLIEAVGRQDIRAYRDLVTDDVSSFETDIAPFRIDDIEFHIYLMSQRSHLEKPKLRYDILTPRIQLYGDFAIATYTLLSTLVDLSVQWKAFNETRVFVKQDGRWRMAHLHRSGAPTPDFPL